MSFSPYKDALYELLASLAEEGCRSPAEDAPPDPKEHPFQEVYSHCCSILAGTELEPLVAYSPSRQAFSDGSGGWVRLQHARHRVLRWPERHAQYLDPEQEALLMTVSDAAEMVLYQEYAHFSEYCWTEGVAQGRRGLGPERTGGDRECGAPWTGPVSSLLPKKRRRRRNKKKVKARSVRSQGMAASAARALQKERRRQRRDGLKS
jgi:hypothetical protein